MTASNGAGALVVSAPDKTIYDSQYDVLVTPSLFGLAEFDILVPLHGHIDLSMACVKSLYENTHSTFHLLLMNAPDDDGLTDFWIKSLQDKYNNITHCRLNPGRPVANWCSGNTFFNCGLRYAKTEYMVTMMNSVTALPNWDVEALKLIRSDPLIGTVGFKCLFPNGLIESAGIAFGPHPQGPHIPTDLGRDLPGHMLTEIKEVQASQWAFALHRVKALQGNLDENVFHGHVGWDDIDNNMVLRSKGWKIMYCGFGAGVHSPRASRGSNELEAHVKNQQNARVFFKRWGLWREYLEGTQMDVGAILSYQTKAQLTEVITKIQVLKALLSQCEKEVQPLVNGALQELRVAPEQYLLEMNPQRNAWVLKPNGKAIMERSQQAAVATTIPAAAAPAPAGDTEQAPVEAAKL